METWLKTSTEVRKKPGYYLKPRQKQKQEPTKSTHIEPETLEKKKQTTKAHLKKKQNQLTKSPSNMTPNAQQL